MFDLFKEVLPAQESQVDNTNITSMLLYFSEQESAEFKSLCKIAMAQEVVDYKNKGNVSDLLLTILRKYYGKSNS